jgi:hypothetical protein
VLLVATAALRPCPLEGSIEPRTARWSVAAGAPAHSRKAEPPSAATMVNQQAGFHCDTRTVAVAIIMVIFYEIVQWVTGLGNPVSGILNLLPATQEHESRSLPKLRQQEEQLLPAPAALQPRPAPPARDISSWREVQVTQKWASSVRVWVMASDHAYDSGKAISFAILESSRSSDREISLPPLHKPPQRLRVGVELKKGAWSYRRAFAHYGDGHTCSRKEFAAHSDIKSLHPCFVTSTHRAWSLMPSVYVMQIPLSAIRENMALNITVFGGIEECSMPLETLNSSTDWKTFAKQCNFAKVLNIEDVRPIVTFSVPQLLATSKEASTKVACDFASNGAWDRIGSTWNVPGCNHSKSTIKKGRVCMIGDSHFERSMGHMTTLARSYNFESSILQENFIGSARLQDEMRAGRSILDEMRACRAAVGNNGIIVVSAGSHFPTGSAAEYQKIGTEVARFAIESSKLCFIVVPALDGCFEAIPDKFDATQRIFRNGWKAEAQSAAFRLAIETARTSGQTNVHFVDLFSPSASLHFTHCTNNDPVHFNNGKFYQEQHEIIYSAAQRLCKASS